MHEKLNSMRRELTEILRSDRLLKSAVREVNKMDMIKGSLIIRNSRHDKIAIDEILKGELQRDVPVGDYLFIENFGKVITSARLRKIMEDLIAQGAHCIDLVTPTHFTPWVLEALEKPLGVPVVWNSGGYERVETLRTLEGKVQIYLPDLKYAMERPARELSAAPDYFEVAAAAIDEMVRQVGAYQIGDDGLMRSGVILRHLVLPGQMENTKRVIDYVSAHFPPKAVLFSLMSQYTPQSGATGALARRLNEREYCTAVQYMRDCGLTDGFCQELSSAKEEYTPVFDLQGV